MVQSSMAPKVDNNFSDDKKGSPLNVIPKRQEKTTLAIGNNVSNEIHLSFISLGICERATF